MVMHPSTGTSQPKDHLGIPEAEEADSLKMLALWTACHWVLADPLDPL